jgi:hypothetical protein
MTPSWTQKASYALTERTQIAGATDVVKIAGHCSREDVEQENAGVTAITP